MRDGSFRPKLRSDSPVVEDIRRTAIEEPRSGDYKS